MSEPTHGDGQADHPAAEPHNPEVTYDRSPVNWSIVQLTGGLLIASAIVIHLACCWLLDYLHAREGAKNQGLPALWVRQSQKSLYERLRETQERAPLLDGLEPYGGDVEVPWTPERVASLVGSGGDPWLATSAAATDPEILKKFPPDPYPYIESGRAHHVFSPNVRPEDLQPSVWMNGWLETSGDSKMIQGRLRIPIGEAMKLLAENKDLQKKWVPQAANAPPAPYGLEMPSRANSGRTPVSATLQTEPAPGGER